MSRLNQKGPNDDENEDGRHLGKCSENTEQHQYDLGEGMGKRRNTGGGNGFGKRHNAGIFNKIKKDSEDGK